MRKLLVGSIALAGAWIFTIAMYGRLDDPLVLDWNQRMQAVDAVPRVAVLVMASVFLLLLPALAIGLSRLDSRAGARNRDPQTYWTIWNITMCLLAAVQVFLVAASAGWDVSVSRVVPTLLGAFFIVFGNVEPRLRPNWLIGTRTPWTMTSDDVWRRTHRLGGRMSVAGGGLIILGAWASADALGLSIVIAGFALAVIVPAIYSYVVWRKLGRPGTSVPVS